MLTFSDVNVAYKELAGLLKDGQEVNSRNGLTKEIHPLSFTIEDFSNFFVVNEERVINLPMALAELVWIMTGSDGDWIIKYNKQLKEYSNLREVSVLIEDIGTIKGETYFNAAYGHRMISKFGINQLFDVVQTLQEDKDSRQAVIVYRDPVSDSYNPEIKDKACNIASMFLVRDNKLDITQIVRSQDFIWGLPYNFIQFGFITKYIAEVLKLEVGRYTEMVNSFHIYENHWEELDKIINTHKEYNYDYDSLGEIGARSHVYRVRDIMENMENGIEFNIQFYKKPYEYYMMGDDFWSSALWVFNSFWLYKHGDKDLCIKALQRCRSLMFRSMLFAYYKKYYSADFKEYVSFQLNFTI